MKRFLSLLTSMAVAVVVAMAGQTYALITAVSGYADSRNNTHMTTDDAKNFRKIMRNVTENITLMTSENATAAATAEKLKKFAAGTKADDRIVFFYSGHGDDGSASGKAGLFMHDGKVLDYETILKILHASKAKEKIIIINACFSGKIGEAMKATGIKDVVVLASSRANEPSYEDLVMGGCYFTRSLEKAYMGKADVNHDKKVTLKEAFKYIHKDVVSRTTNGNYSEPQHPVLFAPKGSENMVLIDWNK